MLNLVAELQEEMTREVTVECVESEEAFERLERDWNRLLFEGPRPVPFLTWEWVSTWWQHFGRNSRLFVLVARDQSGELVGIAPMHVVERKRLGLLSVRCVEFLGHRGSAVCTDHLDFLARPTQRVSTNQLLFKELARRQDDWDCLAFADLAEDSLIPDLMARTFRDDIHSVPGEKCPYIELPEHWEDLLGSMKSKHRTELKRRREKLTKDFLVNFEWSDDPGRAVANVQELGRLHSSSRRRHGQSGNFAIPEYREFHCAVAERMAQAGYLYMATLTCHGDLVACLYGFHCGGRVFGYQTGFDSNWAPRGVGAVLQSYVLEDAIERLRAFEYDFLRGMEDYKYRWTTRVRSTKSVFWWRPSFAGHLVRAAFLGRGKIAAARRTLMEFWSSHPVAPTKSNFADD